MLVTLVLVLSILLQFVAAFFSFRLALVTTRKTAWLLIASAILLMAVQRSFTLIHYESLFQHPDLSAELIALTISIFLAVGISWISIIYLSLRRSERALRESDIKYRKLLDTANDAIIAADIETGLVIDANKKMSDLLGTPVDRIVGSSLTQLYPPEEAGGYHEKLLRTCSSQSSCIRDLVLITARGVRVPVEISAAVTELGDRKIMLAIIRDIADRVRSEEELTRRAQFLEKLLIVSRDIVTTPQLPLLFRKIITTARELLRFDYSTLMLLSGSKDRLIIQDTIGFPESAISTFSLVSGQGLASYVMAQRTAGTVADFQNESRFEVPPMVFENHITSGVCVPIMTEHEVLGVLIGHTRERRAFSDEDIAVYQNIAAIANSKNLQALEESERKHRDFFDNAPDMYHSLDRNGIIIDCNETEARMLGCSKHEIIGRRFVDFLTGKSRKQFREQFEALTPENALITVEREFVRKDGTTFPASLNVYAEFNETRSLVRTRTIARDISERLRMERELLKGQKLESLGILAGGIAHDFNNLLAAILGNVSLAKLHADGHDTVTSRLDEAEKASLRARDLTQQLLTFSKGGVPIKKTMSVADIVNESSSFALRGADVRCDCRISEDLWPVEIDPGQITQVLNNLIINADQAMPKGGTIRITVENVTFTRKQPELERKGKFVKITVEDEGVGIPEEHLGNIFDPYFTTKKKGSGLGLATSYSIITKHDGHIVAESIVGKGTQIHIYLPPSRKKTRMERVENGALMSGKGRILIMDDEEAVRDVTGEILRRLGYEVEFAKDGDEAVDIYRKHRQSGRPFDAVIMDLTVPGGQGGKDAIRAMQSIDPAVKAIVSSGYSNDPVMADFRLHGFSGVVTKPCGIHEMSRVLHAVLTSSADQPAE